MRPTKLIVIALPVFAAAMFPLILHSAGSNGNPPPALETPHVKIDAPRVTAPPESFFQMLENRVKNPNRGGGRRRRANTNDVAEVRPPAAPSAEQVAAEMAIYRKFYKKYIDVKGMPVAASAEVADLALQRTYDIVTHMLAGWPDVLQ